MSASVLISTQLTISWHLLCLQDASWRQLLKFCAARGAFRGAGSESYSRLLRSGHDPGSAWSTQDSSSPTLESAGAERDEPAELADTILQLAELSVLGAGDADLLHYESVEEFYASMGGEEVPSRIIL